MAYTYKGTKITGTSTTAKVFSKSGIKKAVHGQTYLNTDKGYVYICTTGGKPDKAKWKYDETAIIGKPNMSVWNLATPTRSGYTFTSKWKVPDKLIKATNGRRATALSVDWYLGIAGTDPKAHRKITNQEATSVSVNLNNQSNPLTIQGKTYTRQSFYPFPKKPYLSYITCTVLGQN
jgi:hypothetical protein